MNANLIDVLIPTYDRLKALAVTLTSLCFQTERNFNIIVSDQSPNDYVYNDNSVQTAIRLLKLKGNGVTILRNLPRRGMAQQRQFLLERSTAPFVLFLDDDLILDEYVINNMRQVLVSQHCGFVGSAVIGLSFLQSYRPHEQEIEIVQRVSPENVQPGTTAWHRYKLHNAANLFHVQQNLKAHPDNPMMYKVAWVGGCVMYDRQKLLDVGGFNFWTTLPEKHCGEDVLAQLRVMKRYGGCGIIPSGVYHQELETTVPDRSFNAPELITI